MPSVTRKWRKWMAVSCSHGADIDPKARAAVLKFKRDYKPDKFLHLGDAVDMACLRAGARRDPDEPDRAESLLDDMLAGISFLHECFDGVASSTFLMGNHEARAVQLMHSGNQVVAYAAGQLVQRIHDELARYKTEIVPYAGLNKKCVRKLGDVSFLHGELFNVSAARDTAETIGGHCVFGHTHKIAMEAGRTHADAMGFNLGCLIRLDAQYAQGRRATCQWKHGFAFGSYCDDAATVTLHTLSPHYRLP